MSDQADEQATTDATQGLEAADTADDDSGEYTPRQVVADDLDGLSFEDAIAGTIVEFDDGDIVKGTVVKVDKDEVLLDIGFKSEGVIPARELSIRHDVDPGEIVSLGEEIEALVLQKEDKEGRLILSKKRAQYERAWGTIEKIKESEGVVKGPVIEVVKGGLILDIGLRGFLPASLVELRRVRDLQPYVGRELEAKIIELDLERERISLSLKATQQDPWQEFAGNHRVGELVYGRVTKLVPFGAFVQVGDGIEGLVHISEMAEHHVDLPEQVVTPGEELWVKIIDLDLQRRRISLSIKQAAEGGVVAQEYQEAFGEHAYDEQGQYIGTTEFEPETEAQAAWADLAAEYSTGGPPAASEAEPGSEAEPENAEPATGE